MMVKIVSHNFMIFTKEQKKEAYKKLSPEVQDFIMDPETTEIIDNLLTQVGLNDEQSILADSEILNAMYGLITLDDALKNISQITNKTEGDLSELKTKLVTNIFTKLDQIKIKNDGLHHIKEIAPVVSQISQKYGLNQDQQDIVIEITQENIENTNILGKENEISERLNISKLLAEQIIFDINKRIFEQKSKGKSNLAEEQTTSNEKLMSSGTQLELKPDNLPVVEANEPLRVNPVPTFTPKPTFQNEVLDKQAPIGVPRYAEEVPKTPTVNPILEKKLWGNVGSNSAPIKYEKDPYREPIN